MGGGVDMAETNGDNEAAWHAITEIDKQIEQILEHAKQQDIDAERRKKYIILDVIQAR